MTRASSVTGQTYGITDFTPIDVPIPMLTHISAGQLLGDDWLHWSDRFPLLGAKEPWGGTTKIVFEETVMVWPQ